MLANPASLEMPCIRCGRCAQACPATLQPQQLLQDLRGSDSAGARSHGLLACSECALCDAACPSHIQLASRFAKAKLDLVQHAAVTAEADGARQRFESRNARHARESLERHAKEGELAQAAASTDAVAAAIERARLRRQQRQEGK